MIFWPTHTKKGFCPFGAFHIGLGWAGMEKSGVHVLLVSLSLVYQLSGQFLIFLVDQIFFWYTKFFFGILNIFLVDQIFFSADQISFWYTKFFFCFTKIFFWSTKFFLVDQINEKLTEQLVYQRD